MGRVVELRAGAREPQVGDRLAWDGMGWVPEVNIARPRGVTHVHSDTIVHVVMGPWRSPDFVSGSSGWQFDADGSLEANDITARGTIYAEAGEIAGWTLAVGHLYAGSGAARVGLKPGTYPFYAGAEAEASAPFRVNTAGEVWATNAHITGEIDANSGHLGTLDIDGVLTVGTGAPVIQIDGPNKRIRTSDFVSGQAGWEIAHEGKAEFGNLFVRGELHAVTFMADEMHAAGSTLAVMTAAKVADPENIGDNKLLTGVGNLFVLTVQASWDTGACYIADDDVLRIKTMAAVAAGGSLDLWDVWLEVFGTPTSNGDRDLANGNPGTHQALCYWRQGGEVDLVIPTGSAVVVWGHIGSTEGGIILTSDLNYSPYMDIFTIPAATPWSSGTTPHVRVGNLDGVLSLGEEWGIAAGEDLSDATKGHVVLSNERVRLWGVAQRWWDTSGNLRGQVDPTAGASDVLFWLGPSEAGAHFKVLGSGDVWLDTLAISDDLGDFMFSQADGLLLLGPNCEINDSEWWSLRRQKATITGAFHQEAGRWLGTRGLVVEVVTTNIITNPSFETNLTSWTGFNQAATYPLRVSTTGYRLHKVGTYHVELKAADNNAGGMYYDFAGAESLPYTFSANVDPINAAGVTIQIGYRVGAGGWVTESTAITSAGKHSVTITTAAGATSFRVWIFGAGDTNTYRCDAMQLEGKLYPTSYCDGSLDWCSWTGVAHASTSTRVVTEVNLDAQVFYISSEPTISFTLWAQMPYDYNAKWPENQNNFFYDLRSADNDNRIILRYYTTDSKFHVYINGGERLDSTAQSFKAGDWVSLIVTLDFTGNEYKLYINGELEDTDTTALTAPVLTDWNLGSAAGTHAGLLQAGATYAEYAALDKVLSATKVAAMYALQRPLVDAGAMGTPGIYILDGKFKMASSLTGAHIEITAEEIAGYSDATTRSFYIEASTGIAMAAGGAWRVDETGQRMRTTTSEGNTRKIRWIYDDANDDVVASVGANWESTMIVDSKQNAHLWLRSQRISGDGWADAAVTLDANDYVASKNAYLDLFASQRVTSVGDNLFLGTAALPVAASDFGGGRGVFSIRNANTVPTSNPAWGGLLYSQAGAGKWRGSGGTVTTFGPADPHCPRCGRDFVLEWENEEQGTHLQVCMWCLAEALGDDKFVMKKTGPAMVARKEGPFIPLPPTRTVRHEIHEVEV